MDAILEALVKALMEAPPEEKPVWEEGITIWTSDEPVIVEGKPCTPES